MRRATSFLLGLAFAVQAWANPEIHGAWSAGNVNGRPLVVQFDSGGGGKINGQPMQWQAMGKLLFIQQNGQVATYSYELKDGKLNVGGGDLQGVAVLSKGTAAAEAAIAKQAKGAPAGQQKGPGAQAAGNGMEIVGKWCDMHSMSGSSGSASRMACFELRADGTYTYNAESSRSVQAGGTASQSSDAGRWKYTGNQLTAQSQRGTVSTYTLEKRNHPKNKRDPMICLNGTCYVTFYNKPAW
jgi:hypothetical protein